MDRQRGPFWPLLSLALVGTALSIVFWALPAETEREYDRLILDLLAGAFTVWCLAMLWRTRYWDWLSLAVLAAFFGDALFYGLLARWVPDGWRDEWTYFVRAAFTVSAVMLIAQIVYDAVVWLRDRRRLRNDERPGESS